MAERLRVCVLARNPHKKRMWKRWVEALPEPPHVLEPSDAGCVPPPATGIVVATQLTNRGLASLRPIVEEGRLPVLLLPDGILEYRNTFERPDAPPARVRAGRRAAPGPAARAPAAPARAARALPAAGDDGAQARLHAGAARRRCSTTPTARPWCPRPGASRRGSTWKPCCRSSWRRRPRACCGRTSCSTTRSSVGHPRSRACWRQSRR